MQPLANLLPGIAFARPEPPPTGRKIKSADRAAAWRRDLAQRVGGLLSTAAPDKAAEIERAYERELERGPGFSRVRRAAVFAEPAGTKLNREGLARLERSWAFLVRRMTQADRKAAKDRGGVTRRTLSRSTADVLGALLYLARKHTTVFASIEAIARLANVCRRTACEALAALEAWGVLAITRRRKRVRTATGGVAEAQDTSIYVLQAPEGLAAMALRIFGFGSECKSCTASSPTTPSTTKQEVSAGVSPMTRPIPLPDHLAGGGRIPWWAMIRR